MATALVSEAYGKGDQEMKEMREIKWEFVANMRHHLQKLSIT